MTFHCSPENEPGLDRSAARILFVDWRMPAKRCFTGILTEMMLSPLTAHFCYET